MSYVVKNRIWPHVGYEPHVGQKEVHDAIERMLVLCAGRRFGKSTIGGFEMVPEAVYTHVNLRQVQDTGLLRRFWIVGPNYDDGEKEFRHCWNAFKKLEMPFDKPGSYYNRIGGSMHISLWDGAFQLDVKSEQHEDSLDGEGLEGIVLAESAKLRERTFPKYIRPALADRVGWCKMTSTPEGKNWFYEKYQWGQNPKRKEWRSWRMPSWINRPRFPDGKKDAEILALKADLSEEAFAQQVEASFTEYVGRVFKSFDEEIHVGDLTFNPSLPVYGATDYGWTNPFVWLAIQVDVWDNVYVLGEYREVQKDIEDICTDLKEWPLAANCHTLYPEPARPDDTAMLQKHLRIPRIMEHTGGELKTRIELIRRWLKLVPENQPFEKRKPKLFIDRRCTGLIREMQDYRYPELRSESVRPNKEEPLDKDNHAPEALGRFFKGHFGTVIEPATRPMMRRAVIASAR